MIERRVSLSLPHRVFFTEGVFDPAQTLLRDVLCPAEAEANYYAALETEPMAA